MEESRRNTSKTFNKGKKKTPAEGLFLVIDTYCKLHWESQWPGAEGRGSKSNMTV